MIDPFQRNIVLETERLKIFPLTASQLRKYLACDGSLEASLGLDPFPREIETSLSEVIRDIILPELLTSTYNPLYRTLWIATDKKHPALVASFIFKGPPNRRGEVEVGYGTEPRFRQQRYMTETLSAAMNWAYSRPQIQFVVAETDPANFPSMKVLTNNHFEKIAERDGFWVWRHQKPTRP